MFQFQKIFIIMTACLSAAHGHSHVECSNVGGTGCLGYARFYAYNKAGYEGTAMSRDRNNIVSAGMQNCPAPIAGQPEYTDAYPMASVVPGQSVSVKWPPRGHLSQPDGPVQIFCSPKAGRQDPQKPGDTVLVAQMPYGNCVGSDVSWANCTGAFTAPTTWKAGEIRTCQWVWTLNGGQTYVDCMEYKVVAGPSSSPAPALPASTLPISREPQVVPAAAAPTSPLAAKGPKFHFRLPKELQTYQNNVPAGAIQCQMASKPMTAPKAAPPADASNAAGILTHICAQLKQICADPKAIATCPHLIEDCGAY